MTQIFRKNYSGLVKAHLEKKEKIRNHEMPYNEEEMTDEAEEKDILWQVAVMSESLEKGIMDIRLLMDQIENSVLFQAVTVLSREQKEVLLLRVFYLKSFGEIGSMLGMTAKKAENTYYNAIKKERTGDKKYKEGGNRMKQKRMVWTYGTVLLPLDVGKRARYFQNGMLKVTEKVIRVLEQAEDHVKFETARSCYCIAFHRVEENAMALAA